MKKDLVSKLLAGGLSAAVVLVWWAAFFPAAGVTTWLTRGLAMTLLYELLYLSFSPLERHLWNSRPARALSGRVESWQDRLMDAPDRRRVRGSVALACVATLLPILLLSAGVRHDPPAAPPTTVRRVTVNHETVLRTPVQQVVVEKTVSVAAPAPPAVARTIVVHASTTRTVVVRVTTTGASSPVAPPVTPPVAAPVTAPVPAAIPVTTSSATTSAGATPSPGPTGG